MSENLEKLEKHQYGIALYAFSNDSGKTYAEKLMLASPKVKEALPGCLLGETKRAKCEDMSDAVSCADGLRVLELRTWQSDKCG